MQETEIRFALRAQYEAPQVMCFHYETEGGILSASKEKPIDTTTSFDLRGQETETDSNFWSND